MIERIEVHAAAVPMQRSFDHARMRRTASDSVLVRVGIDGVDGWGEGAPRGYVTAETVNTVVSRLRSVPVAELAELIAWDSFDASVASLRELDLPRLVGGGQPAPAAAAALELALLDAVCRRYGRPVRDAIERSGVPDGVWRAEPQPVPVALVLDLARDPAPVLAELAAPTRASIRHVKVKVPADPAASLALARAAVAAVAEGTTVSLDANCGWAAGDAVRLAGDLAELGIAWVEEPVAPRDWWTMRRMVRAGLPVMLDESCVDGADLDIAARAGAATHINVRVSKCGGLLAAARLVARAAGAGLAYQIGVQVGEVGPLWAAGRALATLAAAPVAVEAGQQDRWFADPLTEPPYAVDRHRYVAEPLDGPGLGVVPTDALLKQCTPMAYWSAGSWQDAA
jgi:L-alanine-DL-glutamate epimerase-like enolase superfamily enzyme